MALTTCSLDISLLSIHCCSWRRYREGSSNVGNGSAPRSSFCVIRMHDFFHKFHSNDVVFCVWFIGSPIRTGMLLHWFYRNLFRTDRIVDINATSSEKFVHCLFHGRCSTFKCYHDDGPVVVKYCRGGTPQFGRNLRQGVIIHNFHFNTS